MARVERCDSVIWFAHIEDGDELLAALVQMEPGTRIMLRVHGHLGVWERMAASRAGAPTPGIKAGDENTRGHWLAIPEGQMVQLDLAEDAPAARAAEIAEDQIDLVPVEVGQPILPTLCIGLDVAWWGGSRADPDSRNDYIEYVMLDGTEPSVSLCRVALGGTYNPAAAQTAANCDADAALVLNVLDQIIAAYPSAKRIVVAVDAPLLALPRAHLPARTRCPGQGNLEYRQPEIELANGVAAGPANWRTSCTVMPGAPLCSRVAALVAGLMAGNRGFVPFGPVTPPGRLGNRILIECFPSEAIWSLGIRGHYGAFTAQQARAYKGQGAGIPRPWPQMMDLLFQNLVGFVSGIGVPGRLVTSWVADIARHLLRDPQLVDPQGVNMSGGKLFDDAIDSANCLFTAVAFAVGTAHVWTGQNPADGHIVGPGR